MSALRANYRPLMLKGLRLQKFQATFAVRREATATAATVNVVFNGTDQDDMDYLKLSHANTKTAPFGYTILDGAGGSPVTSETRTSANMPTLGQSDVMWVRVTNNGSAVTVKCVVNAGTPTEGDWTGASNCYSSSSFRSSGGMIGFKSEGSTVSIDDVTVKSWNAGTSAFDITEMYEPFTVDASGGNTGFANETTTNDANGNLTYDGTLKFTYDAWNRLVKAAHAYRDSGGTLQSGQVFETCTYDGRGRRISKAISGTGAWDCTFHYYLDHESVIEERNGSGQVIRQNVFGLKYIDELIQEKVSSDPTSGGTTLDKVYWAMQDANYNVLGVVDSGGVLKERYEYTPYGQRTVFFSPGTNDVGCYAPTIASRKITSGSITQPWGVNEIGHQGLHHDEEVQLVQNRVRMLHPTLQRFMQRDPLGYIGGSGLVEYNRSNPVVYRDFDGQMYCGPNCKGKPYNPFKQCCTNTGVVSKVLIWICETPGPYHPLPDWLTPWWMESHHSDVCCDGPFKKCYGKNGSVKKAGDSIPRQYPNSTTSTCEEMLVCPCVKKGKCENPTADASYDPFWDNCNDWAWDDVSKHRCP